MAHTTMIRLSSHVSQLVAVIILLLFGWVADVGAQAGCFGDLFPTGALAGSGNCDGIRAGRAAGLLCNPTHAVWGDHWSASGGYWQLYGLDELQRAWAAGKYCRSMWGVGMTLSQWGKSDFYTETAAVINFGRRLRQNLAVGIGFTHLQLAYTPELPDYTGWSLGMGIIYQPLKQIFISGAAHHIAGNGFISGYDLPRKYYLSAAFAVSTEIQLGASWLKQQHDRDLVGLGQRLGLVKNLYFLSAVYLDPARYALGAEFILRGQAIVYTYLSHPDLGGTHYVEFEIGQ